MYRHNNKTTLLPVYRHIRFNFSSLKVLTKDFRCFFHRRLERKSVSPQQRTKTMHVRYVFCTTSMWLSEMHRGNLTSYPQKGEVGLHWWNIWWPLLTWIDQELCGECPAHRCSRCCIRNGSLHQYKFRTILFIGFFDPAKLLDVKVSSWAVPFYINLESSLKEYPTYIT